jgi:hypothetical protein
MPQLPIKRNRSRSLLAKNFVIARHVLSPTLAPPARAGEQSLLMCKWNAPHKNIDFSLDNCNSIICSAEGGSIVRVGKSLHSLTCGLCPEYPPKSGEKLNGHRLIQCTLSYQTRMGSSPPHYFFNPLNRQKLLHKTKAEVLRVHHSNGAPRSGAPGPHPIFPGCQRGW